jgi:hypothetical protein
MTEEIIPDRRDAGQGAEINAGQALAVAQK